MRKFWLLLCMFFLMLLSACGSAQGQGTPTVVVIAATVGSTEVATPSVSTGSSTLQAPSATREPATATVLPSSTLEPATATAPPSSTPEPATATAVPAVEPAAAATLQAADLVYVYPVKNAACQPSSSHHDYPASDIFCPTGTEFVAVTSGVVDFVSPEDIWDPATDNPADRGGLSVAIIGDDGVRYYGSHLSTIAEGIVPGVRVAAGQLLGLTGRSGNARGTDPHVHFGISHPTTPDDWQTRRGEVWPQKYLAAWKKGENVTPVLP